jgi:hypothetical protein
MMRKRAALAIVPGLLLAACSVVGIRDSPEPPSTVIAHLGAVEIRRYPPGLVAETSVAGSELSARSVGFQRLFAYITGRNAAHGKIAMTAPVAQAAAQDRSKKIAMTAPVAQTETPDGAWTVRFFLPADMTEATAPRPLDPRVVIIPVPERIMAVRRFSGQATPSSVATEAKWLDAALADGPWQAEGPLVSWFYDPPWTLPPLRRNEVARAVTHRGAPS